MFLYQGKHNKADVEKREKINEWNAFCYIRINMNIKSTNFHKKKNEQIIRKIFLQIPAAFLGDTHTVGSYICIILTINNVICNSVYGLTGD